MSTSFETTVSAGALHTIVSDMFDQTYGEHVTLGDAIRKGAIVFDEGTVLAQRVTFGRIPPADAWDLTDALLYDGNQVLITRKGTLGQVL